jgi:gamma-glutamylcyclotransferase (GGCT)/AIG2-like uncharacterized protein YtfP
MTFKIQGQCMGGTCENMATVEVLDVHMMDYLNVCDDCHKQIALSVINEGAEHFYEWAEEMYGVRKAVGLTKEIFGETVVNGLGIGSVNKGEEKMITMFTYGILKYPDNIKYEGGINIVENSFIKGHKIYLYNSAFPITQMTNDDTDFVYGTLFEVPESQVLYSYDQTEGYNPKRPADQNMYNRIEVEVTMPNGQTKMANMYYANQRMFAKDINEHTHIPTGNFDDKHMAKSYGSRRRWR